MQCIVREYKNSIAGYAVMHSAYKAGDSQNLKIFLNVECHSNLGEQKISRIQFDYILGHLCLQIGP